jgi:hypothetical protein
MHATPHTKAKVANMERNRQVKMASKRSYIRCCIYCYPQEYTRLHEIAGFRQVCSFPVHHNALILVGEKCLLHGPTLFALDDLSCFPLATTSAHPYQQSRVLHASRASCRAVPRRNGAIKKTRIGQATALRGSSNRAPTWTTL